MFELKGEGEITSKKVVPRLEASSKAKGIVHWVP
jgi:hypothetical protein